MTDSTAKIDYGRVALVQDAPSGAGIILVCEHASNRVPDALDRLGLEPELLASHIAWDPGALGVARGLAKQLAAPLISGGISRLVYDCNRPPEARDAILAVSEVHDIPGNANLSSAERDARIAQVYEPFRTALAQEIAARRNNLRLMVTVHSFTPVFRGQTRAVEIGILHGRDAGFATAMMANRPDGLRYETRLNEPYSPSDGVAHTLDVHGADNNLPSVMLEIRNDLIASAPEQAAMADILGRWITTTLADMA